MHVETMRVQIGDMDNLHAVGMLAQTPVRVRLDHDIAPINARRKSGGIRIGTDDGCTFVQAKEIAQFFLSVSSPCIRMVGPGMMPP